MTRTNREMVPKFFKARRRWTTTVQTATPWYYSANSHTLMAADLTLLWYWYRLAGMHDKNMRTTTLSSSTKVLSVAILVPMRHKERMCHFKSLSRSKIIKLAVIYKDRSKRSSELQSQIGLDRYVRPARINYLRTNGHLKCRSRPADVLWKVSGTKLTLCQPGIVQSCAWQISNHNTRNRINTISINSLRLRPYFMYCVKMGGGDLLAHVKVVEQARELVGAIRMLTTDQTYAHAFAVLHRCLGGDVQFTSMSSLGLHLLLMLFVSWSSIATCNLVITICLQHHPDWPLLTFYSQEDFAVLFTIQDNRTLVEHS